MNIKPFLGRILRKASDYCPELLTAAGIASFVTAIVLAAKATPKAESMITEAEDEKGEELTTGEKVKAGAKAYIPTMVSAGIGTICTIEGMRRKNAHIAEITTAFGISQAMLKRYDEKIAELDGEDRAREVKAAVHNDICRSNVAQESISKLPAQNGTGMHPFWDPLSNTPFYANKEILDRAEVAMNKRLFSDGESYLNVNDLYDELNDAGVYPLLRHTAVGPKLGWRAEDGGIQFPAILDKGEWDDGTPCYVMGFRLHHEPDYI
jgi:hypothetical protein